jgi:hypothetical protein
MAKQPIDPVSHSGITRNHRDGPVAHVQDLGHLPSDSAGELSRLRILLVEMLIENQRLRDNLYALTGEPLAR